MYILKMSVIVKYSGVIGWCVLCCLLWMGNAGGRAATEGAAHTGAPTGTGSFEPLCSECHSGGAFGTQVEIEVRDPATSELLNRYTPGAVHKVSVVINTTSSPSAYGFQLVALRSSDQSNAGVFSNPGTDVQFTPLSSNARTYAEHVRRHTSDNSFEFDWTAPVAGTGEIVLYASGNAVNSDFDPGGDLPANTSLVLPENTVTANEGLNLPVFELNVYPNPANSELFVQFDNPSNVRFDVQVYDLLGRIVETREGGTASRVGFSIQSWRPGMYFVRVSDRLGTKIVPFVKR